jgi:ribonuclease HI
LKQVELYTDGACAGNPGPGGWGAILRFGERERELAGFDASTTNNRMELTAVIEGLSALKEPCAVTLYCDSKYIIDAIDKGWAKSWRAKGWVKADKKPALNADLWARLLELLEIHRVKTVWVRGHNGHPENERCDRLAVNEYMSRRQA